MPQTLRAWPLDFAGRTFALMHKDPSANMPGANPMVLYHAPCPDGFAAALCAWQHFDGLGDYIGISHGQVPPDATGRDLYILDIAFDLQTMQRLEAQARRIVLLDHHKTAAQALHGYKCRCGVVKFELNKSAARMAWEYFNPGQEVPALIAHVEDRDLVSWMLDDSPAYLLALDAGPYNFHRWRGVLSMPPHKFEEFLVRGRAMLQFYRKQVDYLVSQARPVRLNGHAGLLTNAPYIFHTDIGLELARRSGSFGAVWCLEDHEGTQRVRIGMRAGADFDTLPIAEAFGRGGHPNSSAFRLPLSRLLELLGGDVNA